MNKKLLTIFVLSLCLFNIGAIFGASFNAASEKNISEKQKRWLAMEKEVDSWVDGIGRHIDPEIKNTVIVFNLLGFKTISSCEGHPEDILSHPWIDFSNESQKYKNLEQKMLKTHTLMCNRAADLVVKQKNNSKHSVDEDLIFTTLMNSEDSALTMLKREYNTMHDEMNRNALSQQIALKNLLEEFYTAYPANHDRMIIIFQQTPTCFRLQSFGSKWQIARNNTEKTKKLKEYQEEMCALTSFLTDKFFNE